MENNRLILEELRNRIIGRFQSILYSGLIGNVMDNEYN